LCKIQIYTSEERNGVDIREKIWYDNHVGRPAGCPVFIVIMWCYFLVSAQENNQRKRHRGGIVRWPAPAPEPPSLVYPSRPHMRRRWSTLTQDRYCHCRIRTTNCIVMAGRYRVDGTFNLTNVKDKKITPVWAELLAICNESGGPNGVTSIAGQAGSSWLHGHPCEMTLDYCFLSDSRNIFL